MSLTARFLLGFALVCSLGLFLLASLLVRRVERQYMEATEEPMVDVANILAEILAAEAVGDKLDPTQIEAAMRAAHSRELKAQIFSQKKTRVDMHIYVTDPDKRVLFDSSGLQQPGDQTIKRDVVLTLLGEYGARSSRTNPYDPLSVVMYVGAPIIKNGKTLGMLSIAKPQRGVLAFVWETERWLKWSILTTIVLMLCGIFLAARWATRPLEHLTRHALAVTRGERPTPPHMPGHQMKTLATALENMRDALEGREYVESYVQNLTHELKSPVAAILGATEILQSPDVPADKRSRFLQNIRSEAGRLRDLLERLLSLASLEKQKSLINRERVNLRDILLRTWDHHAMLATAKNIAAQTEIAADLITEGDPWLIELALSNLIQNAIDFSPHDGSIKLHAYRFEQRNVIEIIDQGPGIPDYARTRVFERFYSLPRPDTGKKSTGLGLCFVREVAQLHSGSIELLPSEVGLGTKAILILP